MYAAMTNRCSFLCTLIFLGIILLTPVSVSAQASCTHTVGNGDQYGTIEAALSAIGQNGAGKVVCVKDNRTYAPLQSQSQAANPAT